MKDIQLQLFIKDEELELHDNESVTLTQTLQDILDLSKVFTDYTRTFNVPASKTNNKILKHYYMANVQVEDFDVQAKFDAELFLNYKPFKKGKVRLENVQMENNSPVNYRITFFGNTVKIKDIIGDDRLQDLDILNSLQLDFNATEVIAKMQDGIDVQVNGKNITDMIIYPLITHTDRLFYDSGDDTASTKNLYYGSNSHGLVFDQLKPAVKLHGLLEAIMAQYQITFSTDFFSQTNAVWNNLYMWLHKDKGTLISTGTLGLGSAVANFRNLTGRWTDTGTSFRNKSGAKHKKLLAGFSGMGVTGYANGIIYGSYSGDRFIDLTIETSATDYDVRITGGYREVIFEGNFSGNSHPVKLTDGLKMRKPNSNKDYPRYKPEIACNQNATFTVKMKVFESNDKDAGFAFAQAIHTSSTFYKTTPANEMPEIKTMDFLTGIFKMFNLTSYLEKDTDVIEVIPLSDWYNASSTTYDISEFMDLKKSQVSVPLPYQEIDFSYEGNESFLSFFHKQRFNNKVWGALSYNANNETGKTYEVKLPFEHFKFENLRDANGGAIKNIMWGWAVDENQESYVGKPLIFYSKKVTSGTPITALETSGGTRHQLTSYYIPSNLVDPTSSANQSIHFGVEKNEYNFESANKSLFQTYYQTYIEEIFDKSRRIYKFKAYLPMKVILNLELNDRLIIFNELYKINKITTNFETGLSDLELINEVQSFSVPVSDVIGDVIKTIDEASLVTVDSTKLFVDSDTLKI